MGYYDFPHTRDYDQDLGFLIKQYKELGKDYETLVKIYEKIQKDITNITLNQLKEWLDDGIFNAIIDSYIFNGLYFNVLYPPNGMEPLIKYDTSSEAMKKNSQLLQQYITYLSSLSENNRGIIYFPKGNYFFSDSIFINNKQIQLQGEGTALVNLIYSNPTNTFITVNGSSNNILNYFSMKNLALQYAFYPNAYFTTEPDVISNKLLEIKYCQYSTIEECIFYYSHILLELDNSYGVRFINSQLQGNSNTLYGCNVINRVDSSIFNNVKATNLDNVDSIAFRIVGTNSLKDIQLLSCETNGWKVGFQLDGSKTNFPVDVMLNNCICDKFFNRGISITNTPQNSCIVIDGGWGQQSSTITQNNSCNIIYLGKVQNITITNFQFNINKNFSVITPLYLNECRNIVVNSNVFVNGYRNIYSNSSRFITINGNSFKNLNNEQNEPSILFVNGLYCNVVNNTFDGKYSYFLMSINNSNLFLVNGNIVLKDSVGSYQLTGANNEIGVNIVP